MRSYASHIRPFLLFALLLSPVTGCGPGGGDGRDEAALEEGIAPLTGDYLGQTPPAATPELFAPGLVSTGIYTRDLAMTPDGSELYFGVLLGPVATIVEMHRGPDGVWSPPEVAPFATDSRFFHLEPTISPDGSRFMFLSTRVEGREAEPDELRSWTNQDIWVMDREGDHWGEPYNLGPPVNTAESEFYPSLTRDGTLYFTRSVEGSNESHIYRSRWVDGAYLEAERLGPEVNSTASQYNAFIAPDESYIILPVEGREDAIGGTDYYVVFRNEDDVWSEPVNLGEAVNTEGSGEMSAFVSRDGRFFFFMSTRVLEPERIPPTLTWDYIQRYRMLPEIGNAGIYWMDAAFIEALRPEGF